MMYLPLFTSFYIVLFIFFSVEFFLTISVRIRERNAVNQMDFKIIYFYDLKIGMGHLLDMAIIWLEQFCHKQKFQGKRLKYYVHQSLNDGEHKKSCFQGQK